MVSSRKQFTFYSSFFETAKRIKSKAARADLYDTICRYALEGIEPDLDKLPESVAVAFINAKPNLDASRKKAENGKHGGSKPKANGSKPESSGKQSASEKENEIEKEKENEIEGEKDKRSSGEASAPVNGKAFTSFWDAYPCKIGRESAWEAWKERNPDAGSVQRIMEGLEGWKQSEQWAEEGGRFVPRAAKFLTEGHWQSPPMAKKEAVPKGASGQLGTAELEAIEKIMREEGMP